MQLTLTNTSIFEFVFAFHPVEVHTGIDDAVRIFKMVSLQLHLATSTEVHPRFFTGTHPLKSINHLESSQDQADKSDNMSLDGVYSDTKNGYAPKLTEMTIAATGPKAHPRLAQIMPSLLRHLHDFAREVDLTVAEWTAGVELINQAGQMSDNKRNETQLICDILGLESLVDEITSKILQQQGSTATPSAILGPFYRVDAPILPVGSSIVAKTGVTEWDTAASDMLTRLSGCVLNAEGGKPIANAIVDVWEAGPNGMYEQQDADQPDMNLRGRFKTDDRGRYSMICLRPTPYPIPLDGPAGKFLSMLDRHPYRPAHIHFIVSAEGYRPLTTQLFDKEDRYTKNDSVFAVKEDLLVEFREAKSLSDEDVKWELEYDFHLPKA